MFLIFQLRLINLEDNVEVVCIAKIDNDESELEDLDEETTKEKTAKKSSKAKDEKQVELDMNDTEESEE